MPRMHTSQPHVEGQNVLMPKPGTSRFRSYASSCLQAFTLRRMGKSIPERIVGFLAVVICGLKNMNSPSRETTLPRWEPPTVAEQGR